MIDGSFSRCLQILLRCTDVLHHTKEGSEYGFINFNVYPMIIPRLVKTIYILGEPLTYGTHGRVCDKIASSLVQFLGSFYPDALIVVRRGHHYDGMLMLMKASVTICPTSSFCLWPAISNNHNAYFAHIWFRGHADIFMTEHFHWLNYPPLTFFGHLNVSDENIAESIVKQLSTVTAV